MMQSGLLREIFIIDRKEIDMEEIKSPVKAIRAFCLECCGNAPSEVKTCVSKRCPLYAFRFGKNPYVKRELTDEQREAAIERLAAAREKNE